MISGIVIGVVAMSICATIAVMAMDDGKDKMAVVFSGPIMWLCVFCCFVGKITTKHVRNGKYQSLLICPDGKIRRITPSKTDTMINCDDRDYAFPAFKTLNEWVGLWPSKYTTTISGETAGSMRYTPKEVWKKYEPISVEDYKHAKINQCM